MFDLEPITEWLHAKGMVLSMAGEKLDYVLMPLFPLPWRAKGRPGSQEKSSDYD